MKTVATRTKFDRNLLAVARGHLWDTVPEAVKYVASVMRDDTQSTRDRLKAAGMILDRTIPTVQSVRGVVQHLGDPNSPAVDWVQLRQQALESLGRTSPVESNGNGDGRIH